MRVATAFVAVTTLAITAASIGAPPNAKSAPPAVARGLIVTVCFNGTCIGGTKGENEPDSHKSRGITVKSKSEEIGISCPPTCSSVSVKQGEPVTLTTRKEGDWVKNKTFAYRYRFEGWDVCPQHTPQCKVTVGRKAAVTAYFTMDKKFASHNVNPRPLPGGYGP